ncbi:hypothetical protein PF049_05280 [Erythrobacteraceae bacterium WH01K]|nr:hypothetical protein PF049_05280 [Erythrobacteraceae bacterium WH01K]
MSGSTIVIKKAKSLPELDESELEVFVTKTLTAVLSGISTADRFTRPENANLELEAVRGDDDRIAGVRVPFAHQFEFGAPEQIEFDIAVHMNRKSGKSGGLKISVAGIGGNADASVAKEDMTVSRVTFKVPMKRKD